MDSTFLTKYYDQHSHDLYTTQSIHMYIPSIYIHAYISNIHSNKKKTNIVYEFIDKNYSSFNDKTLYLCNSLETDSKNYIYTTQTYNIYTKAVMIFMTHGNKTLDFEVMYLSEYLHIQLWGFLCLH